MSASEEADDLILNFEPFDGDFGAPGDTVLSNKMVVARKPGPCAHCGIGIQPGERVRSQSSKFDGELMSHRWCALCCAAMSTYDDELEMDSDYLPEYERRSGLARKETTEGQSNG